MIHPDATVEECMQEISALEAEIERLRAENEHQRKQVNLLTEIVELEFARRRRALEHKP